MTEQLTITWDRQNTRENQLILEMVKPKLTRQCRVVLTHLKMGKRLTVGCGVKGLWDHEEQENLIIGDMRARIRDLIKAGYEVKKELMDGGFKIYSL